MREKRVRDSQKSREDILNAAEAEFSEKGIYGTRIDEIAVKANINKRMIYEYFGNKEALYKAVLVQVYSRLSQRESSLLSGETSPVEAIRNMVRLYFEFLRDNPSYVNMIQWENLNKGKYIQEIDLSKIKDPSFEQLRKIIAKGKQEGVFKEDIDSEQFILALLTDTFSYFSNRYTLSKMLGWNLDSEENIKQRIETVTAMFLWYLCK